MYAVLCNPIFWNQINNLVTSKDEEILIKDIDNDIDVISNFEKIGRVSIKHLILDISAIQDPKKLLNCIKRYRIKNDKTQIIIIAPNVEPPNQLIYSLVTMGIYDIIAPKAEKLEDISLSPYLLEVLENPSTYKKAVRWFSDEEFEEDEENEPNIKKDKIKEKPIQGEKIVELEVEKVVEKIVEREVLKTIKQQVITFYTADNNLSKDNVITQIAVLLAKKSEQKILVMDMNLPTPTLDHYFGIEKEIMVKDIYNTTNIDTGLSACYGSMEKRIFSAELLKEFVVPFSNYKNLDILTGVYDLDLVERFDVKHFETIIETATEIYDTILISVNPFWCNTATYTSIVKSNRVIVTSDSNWPSCRNAMTIIKNEYVENQNIPKEKFNIILTNISQNSLDKDVLNKIFEGFNILGYIPFNKYCEESLNKKKPFILSSKAKKDTLVYLDIISKLGYIPKLSLKDKIFNKKKIIDSVVKEGE